MKQIVMLIICLNFLLINSYGNEDSVYNQILLHGDKYNRSELGINYLDGIDVKKDSIRAIALLTKSADEGYQRAEYNLGVCYIKGFGVSKDVLKGISLLEKAAKQGHKTAQYTLGVLYYDGRNVAKNLDKSKHWLTLLEKQGDGRANYYLNRIHAEINSNPEDSAPAWFLRAMEKDSLKKTNADQ